VGDRGRRHINHKEMLNSGVPKKKLWRRNREGGAAEGGTTGGNAAEIATEVVTTKPEKTSRIGALESH
jgi:hypothetical protein